MFHLFVCYFTGANIDFEESKKKDNPSKRLSLVKSLSNEAISSSQIDTLAGFDKPYQV